MIIFVIEFGFKRADFSLIEGLLTSVYVFLSLYFDDPCDAIDDGGRGLVADVKFWCVAFV